MLALSELAALPEELKEIERGTEQLCEAVERGVIKLDDPTLQQRLHRARREATLTEIAGLRRGAELPSSLLSQSRTNQFCAALKAKLLAKQEGFAERYLRLLVEEIRFTAQEVLIKGSHSALAHAVGQSGNLANAGVPRFVPGRLPDPVVSIYSRPIVYRPWHHCTEFTGLALLR